MSSVFVVTLQLEAVSQQFFQALRARQSNNLVPAHITLFHAIPAEHRAKVISDLEQVCAVPVFNLDVSEVRFTGNGVMYMLASEQLAKIHAGLRDEWLDWLTNQDRQGYRPHIVVQRKVSAEQAKRTYDELKADFKPFSVAAESLILWNYLDGPWSMEKEFRFSEHN